MDTKQDSSLVYYISVVIIILMAIGTVFVFSASASVSADMELHRFYSQPSLRQIIFFPIAILIMFAVSKIDYHKLKLNNELYKTPAAWLLAFSVILVMLVLIPKVGVQVNQARRWFRIPLGFITLSFQPSELAKWTTIFFMVSFCYKYKDSLHDFWKRFVPAIAIMSVPVGLIIIEDFGTAALITLLTFIILLIGGAKWKHVLAPLPFGAVAFTIAIIHSPHRVMRIAAFLDPEKWADTVAYQANQSLIALGSGGVLGKGIGCGICKYGHLPEDTTDFIFAIIGEEMGFFGVVAVIALFIAFIWLGSKVVKACTDEYGKFLAATIILAIGIQAALNIGVVTVVLPTKGIPLPFVSAGGTSMLLTAAAVGILLSIARQIGTDFKPAVTTVPAMVSEPRKIEIIEHEQAQAVLEEHASELIIADKQFGQEISECQQVIEPAPEQTQEYKVEPELEVEEPVLELASVKQRRPNVSEPLDKKQLTDLSEMAKRLARN